MKLLIYGINFSPELTGIGKYSGEMAEWFAQRGHDVEVICAIPYYPEWRIHEGYECFWWRSEHKRNLRIRRCNLYVPKNPTKLKRIAHLVSFAISSFFHFISRAFRKPDIIIFVSPTLFCAPAALLGGVISRSKTFIHIQDFEVDAYFGLGMAENAILRNLALRTEKMLLNGFDRVSTISLGMIKTAQKKGIPIEKLIFFPNWTDIKHYNDAAENKSYTTSLGVPPDKKLILYSGNIGEKQGLEILLEAAKLLSKRDDLYFLIVGQGAGKNNLVAKCHAMELNNIGFAPLQPQKMIPTLLASADVHLIPQKRGAADFVLPSKLTNILAVGGNAVVSADPDTTLSNFCIENDGIAVLAHPESTQSLSEGILKALSLRKPNNIAKEYARSKLDKDLILSSFEKNLLDTLTS